MDRRDVEQGVDQTWDEADLQKLLEISLDAHIPILGGVDPAVDEEKAQALTEFAGSV